MKKSLLFVCVIALVLTAFRNDKKDTAFIKENFSYANKQLKNMLKEVDKSKLAFPRSINKNGKLVTTSMYDWTPGFFPGSLWYSFEYSNDAELKKAAQQWTETLEPLKTFTQHHDLGFMMYCSYGNAYRLTGNEAYKDILVQSARSLSTRFNPVTGCIKSWNVFKSWHGNKTYNFPVIIDNMMNLELLFFASEVTGDTSFRHIAIEHATNTMKYQVRKDYSSYHVVCYDTITGKVAGRETAQGYADNSTWARGQAWAIYGFTMVYRETKDPRFLKTAEGLADFFMHHKNLPADKIPYWDFNAQQQGYTPGVRSNAKNITTLYRDASAAAVVASALMELSTYSTTKGKAYRNFAAQMLHSLASPAYRAPLGNNGNFLLMQSVGSIPHNVEINVPLVYADYYFLEALQRYDLLLKGKKLFTPIKK
ncbi:glycosyl hydrolase family 88 [Lacibacter luteus]|uniref:Glycosyl hydrolase family 88 n=1 Tax=Lacibacter luteus TaxID=2508719 RepID=A0A4Q1CN17_9BACT|nr:glycoside hydrolase family 88 protein [Lacibacter luteus]RXK62009.1 glycosyl hydrolase family 88 [Lacibacter luteus]